MIREFKLMSRSPTRNNQGLVEWEETATSPEGDSLVISLKLDAVDSGSGFSPDGRDSTNVNWLGFKTSHTVNPDGSRRVKTTVQVDPTGVNVGNSYRLELIADDGSKTSSRTVTFIVTQGSLEFAQNDDLKWAYTVFQPKWIDQTADNKILTFRHDPLWINKRNLRTQNKKEPVFDKNRNLIRKQGNKDPVFDNNRNLVATSDREPVFDKRRNLITQL